MERILTQSLRYHCWNFKQTDAKTRPEPLYLLWEAFKMLMAGLGFELPNQQGRHNMKTLLIQSLILLMATLAQANVPKQTIDELIGSNEVLADSHDITLDGRILVAVTAKQRNMFYTEEKQHELVRKQAFRFCSEHKYARVAVDAAGEPIVRVGKLAPSEFKPGQLVAAWTADGLQDFPVSQVTKWQTRNNNGQTQFEGFGPALVFERLRCADKIQ
jgi:hypothetical protein